ncbi:DUF2752 domain-containing protein [Parapedobacter sp. SGR-10]|uniref:DUF2752 domain-containing protein n=1 Tax=Parapedobacter sp. SGR-10 TaxID=2710879 RepID=UPI0013D5E009|nr:DUF2752 domain-containing protein [Parapedobacter sp. SGR-10]NGF55982.1 DUF2752 domain-containing protein [Parapedobacter sp. SGR-10]
MVIKRVLIWVMLGIGSTGVLFMYKYFNPLNHALFPKCPLKHLTGLDCPGCGSQRALHHLLNGEIEQSFLQNPLLFLMVPYLLLGFYLQLVPEPTVRELKLRKALYGYRAIQVVFVVIILFTIVRNMAKI